jgi:hypothetical protein
MGEYVAQARVAKLEELVGQSPRGGAFLLKKG